MTTEIEGSADALDVDEEVDGLTFLVVFRLKIDGQALCTPARAI
ncbi:MAG: hypothetical protein QOE13_2574 [Gaiellaceae bacterium]|jgi:hypothetical protein|nr:hypothetical protein [Gaiellaceae bacterium]